MTTSVGWADELRVGLRGQVRRVWGRRGVPVRQRVQFRREWRDLFVVIDGRAGQVHWAWLPNVTAATLAQVVGALPEQTDLTAVVWDRAPAHRDQRLRAFVEQRGLALIEQPPYAPELNPAERLNEEIRRAVEGRVYATLEEKVAAVTAVLEEFAADPDRVRRLAGWDWIRQACDSLPPPPAPFAA